MTKTIKSVFAFCFSLLMISLSLMPAFAEVEPMPLSEANVVEYPSIEGTILFTQKIGDCLTITGGKVTTDGTETGTLIFGKWEFIDPDFIPSKTGTQRSDIRFVPDESELYSSFEIIDTSNVRYTVKKAPMEITDPDLYPTATNVTLPEANPENGVKLTTSKITGIPIRCTLTGENITTGKWS